MPGLAISAVEAVQSVQRSDNSIRLVAGKEAIIRVFVDAGQQEPVPLVTGQLRITRRRDGVSWVLAWPGNWFIRARPVGRHDRNDASHSLNFRVRASFTAMWGSQVDVTANAYVFGHEEDDPRTGFRAAPRQASFNFRPRQRQKLLPILIRDRWHNLARPTLAEYFAGLYGAQARWPIAIDGFVVNPPIEGETASYENLEGASSWTSLLMRTALMILFGPSREGIRTAMVPFSGAYAIGGIAVPHPFRPTLVTQAPGSMKWNVEDWELATFAHELGHALGGLQHVWLGLPSNDAPWPYDGRLPMTTDQPGMASPTRCIPAGRPEIMSYGADPRWPSTAAYNIIFDQTPV